LTAFVLTAFHAEAAPPGAKEATSLERADALLRDLEHDAAFRAYEQLANSPRQPLEVMRRAYAGMGLAAASMDNGPVAVSAFTRLLSVAPDYELPPRSAPKLQRPFNEAKNFWLGKTPPAMHASAPAVATEGRDFPVTFELRNDVLGLGQGYLLSWKTDGAGRPGEAYRPGGGATTLVLPIPTGAKRLAVSAQPVNAMMSAIAAPASIEVPVEPPQPEVAVPPPAAAPVVEREPPPLTKRWRFSGMGILDPLARRAGAEVGAAFALTRMWDVGLAASLGQRVGLRASVTLHPAQSDFPLRPVAALRAVVHPLPGGAALGGGLFAGATYELGPGRVVAGIIGEAYRVPVDFAPYALLISAGYQLDAF
jgi:hypothetical protein